MAITTLGQKLFVAAILIAQAHCMILLDNVTTTVTGGGRRLNLAFQSPLNLTLDYASCEHLFHADTEAKLGVQPQCEVTSPNTVTVYPSDDATVTNNDVLEFDDINVSNNITYLINNTDVPTVMVVGPKSMCLCAVDDNLRANVDLSRETGYAPLTNVQWFIYDTLTHVAPGSGAGLFVGDLAGEQGKTEITLQSKWFEDKKTYYLHAVGTNSMANEGTGFVKLYFTTECTPFVEIHFESLVTGKYPIKAKAKTTYSTCANQDRRYEPDWFIIGKDFDSSVDSYSDSLYIPGSLLNPEQEYTLVFRYTVNTGNNQEHKNSSQKIFTILPVSPKMRIVGGNRTVGKSNELKIETSTKIFDKGSEIRFSWKCADEDAEVCVQDSRDMVLPRENHVELNIYDTDLMQESYYEFTASAQDELSRKITRVVRVDVLNEDMPSVLVYAKKPKQCSSDVMSLFADVYNLRHDIIYTWSCHSKYDERKTELNLEIANITASPQDLRIPTIVKNFAPGYFHYSQTVACRFAFKSYGKQIVYGEDEVEISRCVSQATVEAEPTTGEAYTDSFSFKVHGFHDYTRFFRFGYYEVAGSTHYTDKVFLSMWSVENWIDNVKFFTDDTTNPITVFFEIKNDDGLVSTFTKDITLTPLAADNTVKLSKKVQNFTVTLAHDQFDTSLFLLDTIPLHDMNDLSIDTVATNSIQDQLILYMTKFRAQGFIPELISQAMTVIERFVGACQGRMHLDTLAEVINTLNYISQNLHGVVGEVDSLKFAKQALTICNTLLSYPGNLESVRYTTPKVISYFLGKVGTAYDLQQVNYTGALVRGAHELERFYDDTSNTVVTLSENFAHKYKSWECRGAEEDNCTGLLITQVQYDRSLYPNASFDTLWGWRAVSDVYDVRLFNPVTWSEIAIPGPDEFFDVALPLSDPVIDQMSHIQCQIWNEELQIFDKDLCYYFAYNSNGKAFCRCSRLGRIVALYQYGALPTTESPNLDPMESFHFFIRADYDPYCSTLRKKKSTTNKFTYQVQQYLLARGGEWWPKLGLKLSRARLKIVDCVEGGLGISIITMNVTDKLGQVRSWFIKQELERMIYEEKFFIEMKQGGNLHLYDPNQTTPPPVHTIPPIEKVTTNWVPIFVALAVFAALFLVCAFGVYCYQTRLLDKQVFTDINSDTPKELTEEELLAQADKKSKLARLNVIHEESLTAHIEVERKASAKGKIGPINDTNAIMLTDSYIFREQGVLKEVERYALDESDEDDTSTSTDRSTKSLQASKVSLKGQPNTRRNRRAAMKASKASLRAESKADMRQSKVDMRQSKANMRESKADMRGSKMDMQQASQTSLRASQRSVRSSSQQQLLDRSQSNIREESEVQQE